jgi:DNA gyrase subunit A
MEIGLVRKIDIDQEMQQAYLDYAMSVIVSRALPDARDGLKPVHRRILYAMYDMGLRPNSSYKKSARVVGEVLGKYHPHSDAAVYDAMARMVQEFSMRYPLVDGQGNFGSLDGDPPAAMRYTEARLDDLAVDMMADIHKGTVDFTPNFDATLDEPTVLPSAIPNMIVNGATGIAVGMATSIPPHNLNEVIDAIVYMLENWTKVDEINIEDLMQFIQGPDFPTGGVILGSSSEDGLASAYGSGRGRITVQARAHVEDIGRGRERIIVTELPYMTNKAALIERIAKLARDGILDGISDLRDESDRQGMRIVIELTKNADTKKVLAKLYKRTPMQNTFSINILALVDGEPSTLSLKQALQVYIEHRLEIIRRRSIFDLERARQRAHILEGLRIALQNMDEVVALIRRSPDVETARTRLMHKYKLSEAQADAILDMPLRRLAALERKKIETEYKELLDLIKDLEELLKSPKKMRGVVADELTTIKENYGDRRRTQIVALEEGTTTKTILTVRDFAPDQPAWVVVDQNGLVSRTLEGNEPRLWGRAAPKLVLKANTRDTLYLVAENGKAAAIALHSLPEVGSADEGVLYTKVCPLSDKDKVAVIFSLPPKKGIAEGYYIFSVSRGGMVKKSPLEELPGPTAQKFQIAKTKAGDSIGWIGVTTGSDEILMATAGGMAIRFSEEDVRSMGLIATGVNGIKLKLKDEVVGMQIVDKERETFLLASDGNAKRVHMAQFPTQGRYGQGVMVWKLTGDVKLMGLAIGKPNREVTIHLSRIAAKRVRLDDAPIRTRPSNGQPVVELKENDRVVALTVPWEAPSISSNPAESSPKIARPKDTASQMTMDLGEEKPKPPAKTKTKTQRSTAKTKTTARKTTTKRKTGSKTAVRKSTAKPKTTKRPPTRKSAPKRNTDRPKKKA